jgi:hypothetical protein
MSLSQAHDRSLGFGDEKRDTASGCSITMCRQAPPSTRRLGFGHGDLGCHYRPPQRPGFRRSPYPRGRPNRQRPRIAWGPRQSTGHPRSSQRPLLFVLTRPRLSRRPPPGTAAPPRPTAFRPSCPPRPLVRAEGRASVAVYNTHDEVDQLVSVLDTLATA